ncbi:hypothetical protein ACH47B_20800 [Rhodococcus sp. NPDC019627]|uniref:hypothetical protein n=1 Tax=unclassified Rhodococcus (in: high G+C Gram-positive bacteria) TaxID=192944 RepID=UPI0033EC04BF
MSKIVIAIGVSAMMFASACSTNPGDAEAPTTSLFGADQPRTQWESVTENQVSGVIRPEDLVAVPDTTWVLASSMASPKRGTPGRLVAVDSTTNATVPLWPHPDQHAEWNRSTYPDCAGIPDTTSAEPHGIAIAPATDRQPVTLYAVNHKRESIEVFDLDPAAGPDALTWVGCVPIPRDVYANAVAPLPDGSGIIVSSMFDPTASGDPFARMFTGADTGRVMKWTPAQGWTALPDSAVGGANGVLVSPDGQSVLVAAWTQKKLVRMSLTNPRDRSEVALPFLPDNLRWTPQGTILVTGQNVTVDDVLVCNGGEGTHCPTGYAVVEVDPSSMTSTVLIDGTDSSVSLATTALPVGDEIWLGTLSGDRIVRLTRG